MTQSNQNNTPGPNTNVRGGLAGVFVDYDNLYHYLRENYADLPDLNDSLFDILRNFQHLLQRRTNLRPTIMQAFADFEEIGNNVQASLYLMGIDPRNSPTTGDWCEADMMLSINVMEVIYTRPDISTFILVVGDREYIPLVQQLKRMGRNVLVVAFREDISGDLLLNVGAKNFYDALALISPNVMKRLERDGGRKQRIGKISRRGRDLSDDGMYDDSNGHYDEGDFDDDDREYGDPDSPPEFQPVQPVTSEYEIICLEVLIRNYGHHPEVWISPFLRKLSDALPALADFERKALLTNLEMSGAIKIEKRRGKPYDYSIILINHNHPAIMELTSNEPS